MPPGRKPGLAPPGWQAGRSCHWKTIKRAGHKDEPGTGVSPHPPGLGCCLRRAGLLLRPPCSSAGPQPPPRPGLTLSPPYRSGIRNPSPLPATSLFPSERLISRIAVNKFLFTALVLLFLYSVSPRGFYFFFAVCLEERSSCSVKEEVGSRRAAASWS